MKRTETEEILYYFFYHITNHNGIVNKRTGDFREGGKNNPLYKSSESILLHRLARGWTLQSISLRLLSAKDLHIHTANLQEIIPENPPLSEKEDTNLLNPNDKYTHPMTKVIKHPVYDAETGNLLEKGSVERKEKFTLSDLINYYLSELTPPRITRKEVSTVLRYSLNGGICLDDILRAIDLASYSMEATTGNDPWGIIREYVPQATEERLGRVKAIADDEDNESIC